MSTRTTQTMPRRIQQQRVRGWRMPTDTVSVARPSRFGNPYRIAQAKDGGYRVFGPDHTTGAGRSWWAQDDRDSWSFLEATGFAVAMFTQQIHAHDGNNPLANTARLQLAGLNLACFCPLLDEHGNRHPCHADVLLVVANPGLELPR